MTVLNSDAIQAIGARELMISLLTPTKFGHGIPTIITGRPGTGKTSFVESLESMKFPVVTLVASLYDATDFSGLPFVQNGRTQFAPPEWSYAFDDAEDGVLFIDEITTCPPAVQAALLRVVLHRKVGSKSLPPRVRIVAAANPPDEFQGGFQLSPPLANRFCHINWEMPAQIYSRGSTNGFDVPELEEFDPQDHQQATLRWKQVVAAFVQRNTSALNGHTVENELAFASPRSYELATALMASCELLGLAPALGIGEHPTDESLTFMRLVSGCIGSAATASFIGFLRNLDLPDPHEFLAGNVAVEPRRMQDDALFVFFCSLATILESQMKEGKQPPKRFILESARVLDLIVQVSEYGKIDSVFGPVKSLFDMNWLQKCIMQSFRSKDDKLRARLDKAMQSLAKTELAKYIAVITEMDNASV